MTLDTRRILLVNLGTTRAPDATAVRDFLSEFLADPMVVDYPRWLWRPILRRILRSRPAKVAEQYRQIWTDKGSPLATGTHHLANALDSLLDGAVDVRPVYRYGEPSLRTALEESRSDAIRRIDVVPLFPQRTGSTTGTIECLVRRLADELDLADRVTLHRIAPDDPGYVSALADTCRRGLGGPRQAEHLVVSFHGIPKRYDRREGRVYGKDCTRTYKALLRRLAWAEERATLSYQSRFGPEPWIGPNTADVVRRLPKQGVRSVAVLTPGFLTEGLETLEEIGIRGRALFEVAGGVHFARLPCVEAHPMFVTSLARRFGHPPGPGELSS